MLIEVGLSGALRLLPALREYSDVKEFTNAADAGSVSAAGSVVQSVAFAIAKHQCRYLTAQVWAADLRR